MRPTIWVVPLALAGLVLRCGSDGERVSASDDGSEPRAGEGGGEDGGSPGDAGANATGGRSGTAGRGGASGRGGSSDRGGTEGRGGSAGRSSGGVSGNGTSGTGGEGDAGGSDAGQGGGGAGGTPEGGEAGVAGEGGSAGDPGCQDPPSTKLCTNDLSGIGTGDFEIKFSIRAGGGQPTYAIMGQRAVCDHGYFWSVSILYGWLYVELDDNNQNYVAFWPYDYLVDGIAHRVVIRRISGVLSTVLDCGTPSTVAAPTDLSMTLAPLSNATNDVCIGNGTFALEGFVTDHCVRPL